MVADNFTVSDLVVVAGGFCLFGLFAFVPGYVFGWLLNIMQFRSRSLGVRAALATPLSIAFCPILSYLVARWLSMTALWVVYGALWFCFVLLLRRSSRWFAGHRIFFVPVAVWVLLGMVSLVDVQIGDRLYFSVTNLDYSIRTAFTNAISTTGIPPHSPLYFPGHPVFLRYHYFWLILCSLVNQLSWGAVGPRQAMIAGTLWCGIGLLALIPLYLRGFDARGAAGLRRRALAGMALLGVTGLDIVPSVLLLLAYTKGIMRVLMPSVEWWNNQVDGWLYTMLWEPHYLAGLIACLTGFLIIWHAPNLVAGVAAGAAFATAVGTSIYIAMVFAVFLAVWLLMSVVKKWYRESAILGVAGLSAMLLSLPCLREMSSASGSAGGALLHLTVRSFYPAEALLLAFDVDRGPGRAILNGLTLPVNYFLELGFFFVIGCLEVRKCCRRGRSLSREELASLTMMATSVVVCTFVRSSVIANNDLGWRGFLIAQFVLLLWGANFLARRRLLTALLVLGAAGTAYDVVILRIYPILSDTGMVAKLPWLAADEQLGKRSYASRRAYEWLQARTPVSAVIQQNPDVPMQDTLYLTYGNRRTVAADHACGTAFGGDPWACGAMLTPLEALFSGRGNPESVCRNFSIDALVAKDTDRAWSDHRSWVWTRRPEFANDFVRIFTCPSL